MNKNITDRKVLYIEVRILGSNVVLGSPVRRRWGNPPQPIDGETIRVTRVGLAGVASVVLVSRNPIYV